MAKSPIIATKIYIGKLFNRSAQKRDFMDFLLKSISRMFTPLRGVNLKIAFSKKLYDSI